MRRRHVITVAAVLLGMGAVAVLLCRRPKWHLPIFGLVITEVDDNFNLRPIRIGEVVHRPSPVAGGESGHTGFRLAQGSLPPGISLDGETGSLLGVASEPGVYTFSIEAELNSDERTRSSFGLVWRVLR